MKKLLLGLSVLAALALSLQASANGRRKAVQETVEAVKGGEVMFNGTRTTIRGSQEAVKLEGTLNPVAAGVRKATQEKQSRETGDLFQQNALGIQRVENNQQCALDKLGGADTSAALATGVMKPSICMTEISHIAKGKLGYALNRIGVYLQGKKEQWSLALDKDTMAGARQAWWSGLAKAIGIKYAEAKSRAAQMCNSCAELNPFCGLKPATAN